MFSTYLLIIYWYWLNWIIQAKTFMVKSSNISLYLFIYTYICLPDDLIPFSLGCWYLVNFFLWHLLRYKFSHFSFLWWGFAYFCQQIGCLLVISLTRGRRPLTKAHKFTSGLLRFHSCHASPYSTFKEFLNLSCYCLDYFYGFHILLPCSTELK